MNTSTYRGQSVLKPVLTLLVLFIIYCTIIAKEKAISEKTSKIDKDVAIGLIEEEIVGIYQNEPLNAIQKYPYKISIYNKLFDGEVKIRHACSSEDLFTCKNDSYLFFVDEVPWAHFKHSVRIGIIDAITEEIQIKQAEWWPVVKGKAYFLDENPKEYTTWMLRTENINHSISYFRSSINPYTNNTITMLKLYMMQQQHKNSCECNSTSLNDDANYQSVIGRASRQSKLWAIIILGAIVYRVDTNKDLTYDADGMYSILNAYGVPDNQIYYFKKKVKDITPLTNDDKIYSTCLDIDSVTTAIDEIQSKIDPADKFLFFICTHGGNWELSLCKKKNQCLNIDDCQMQKWLSKIRCKLLFVIINSCRSGSFVLGDDMSQCCRYDLSIPQGENNDRVVITSCSYNEPSPADIDNCDINKDDRGSEFIGGFFEAFTKEETDCNCDNMISIGEAYNYANKYAQCGSGSLVKSEFAEPSYHPIIKCSKGINPLNEFLFWD